MIVDSLCDEHARSPYRHHSTRQRANGFLRASCEKNPAARHDRPTSASLPIQRRAPAPLWLRACAREEGVSRRLQRFGGLPACWGAFFSPSGFASAAIATEPLTPRHRARPGLCHGKWHAPYLTRPRRLPLSFREDRELSPPEMPSIEGNRIPVSDLVSHEGGPTRPFPDLATWPPRSGSRRFFAPVSSPAFGSFDTVLGPCSRPSERILRRGASLSQNAALRLLQPF